MFKHKKAQREKGLVPNYLELSISELNWVAIKFSIKWNIESWQENFVLFLDGPVVEDRNIDNDQGNQRSAKMCKERSRISVTIWQICRAIKSAADEADGPKWALFWLCVTIHRKNWSKWSKLFRLLSQLLLHVVTCYCYFCFASEHISGHWPCVSFDLNK